MGRNTSQATERGFSMFEEEYQKFWQEFGDSRNMVLSTSLHDVVSSRTMSIIQLKGVLYFQTDCTFRKYPQLKQNPHVALCTGNIQIEGLCEEIGVPTEHEELCNAYKECFPSSYRRYSHLQNERLFAVTPVLIERWHYVDGEPFMQMIDVEHKRAVWEPYLG